MTNGKSYIQVIHIFFLILKRALNQSKTKYKYYRAYDFKPIICYRFDRLDTLW